MKRLASDNTYDDLYTSFMTEYEDLDHMKRIAMEDLPTSHYFLPNHRVLREQSTTTKLRVVFNGSCNMSSGVSLNGVLQVGPKVQVDISDVLLRIRCHLVLFRCGISKMFREIDVDPQEWPLQCIL